MAIVPELLNVVCRITGMGFSAIARVTETHWIACSVQDEIDFGLEPGGELELGTTICNEIRQHHEPVVINDVAKDDQYCTHHTPARYGFQSYISFPIFLKNGEFFGTLCAIDPRPRDLDNAEIKGMFHLFSQLIALHLDKEDELEYTKQALEEEQKTARLRERFISILAHDLRNPLSSIKGFAQLIESQADDTVNGQFASKIAASAKRMNELIDHVVDFANGHIGKGIKVFRTMNSLLSPAIHQVIGEIQIVHPDRFIESSIHLASPVFCDSARVAQLFSNLLENAIKHGDVTRPVKVQVLSTEGSFSLSVTNYGRPIAKDKLNTIFDPFTKGDERSDNKGLGLGLYIAYEIAKAHEGTLTVLSDETQTRFNFAMTADQQ